MRGPKVVLIGAASAFFGRQTIYSMVTKAALNNGTLVLVDPDKTKLGWLKKIAERAISATGVKLKLECYTDYRKGLKKADFVLLAFAVEGVKLRGLDAEVSTKHGMVMCSADTIGPGGIMRTLREIPRQNMIMDDVEKLCPNAWVINWVNPTSAMGIAMMRHYPHIKSMALCDGPHNPRFDNQLMVDAGIAKSPEAITDAMRSRTKIRSGGVNHFNWLVEMTYNGKDVTGKIKDKLRAASQGEHVASSEKGKRNLANDIASQIADSLGFVPKCIWHTMEYLPYWQGHDVAKKDVLAIKQWQISVRRDWMNACWKDMRDIGSGKRKMDDFLENTGSDHASDIIESMWTGTNKQFYINIPNNGSVTNMQDDDYLELSCVVDMHDVRPLPFGEMPRPLRGFMYRVLDEHELAVKAAVTCDRDVLRQAFLSSMVAVSIPDVNNCMDELLRREKNYLPKAWYK
ncbi:MAG: glycoside hydrolase family 4 [Lentisphaeria bacterium]|nr:glycoside hydrolase family 4 [Lentisphaeria bacterium]NQZ70121.1 glycoside hydrolase family 4 [Lentisphaeria bacterium]